MDADLDLLLTAVYVTADDLLPERPKNAKRRVTDAEVVTLCVAQAIMGIPSDRRFVAVARKYLRHLFPDIPAQPGYFKRRRRLVEALEWLMSVFASQKVRGSMTICCSWTTRLSSVLAVVRRSSARRWVTPRTTGTAARIPVSSGVFACTRSSRPTVRPERSRWLRPNETSATSLWSCWLVPTVTAR
jgi:hypothetical protein